MVAKALDVHGWLPHATELPLHRIAEASPICA